jgi:hypothetical protein
MIPKDKVWQRPQLVVLTRSEPAEAVLTACKTGGSRSPGPSDSVSPYNCKSDRSDNGWCADHSPS